MRWVVFESGSRAGLSAELFFRQYIEKTGSDDVLVMADSNPTVNAVACPCEQIVRVPEDDGLMMLNEEDTFVFPADELTRQCHYWSLSAECMKYARVEEWFYDKRNVGCYLLEKEEFSGMGCVMVPNVYPGTRLCLRPNTKSAGSKGLMFLDDYCVTERIDIKREFVVDAFRTDDDLFLFPREVVLKNGYDLMVKLLPRYGEFADKVKRFVKNAFPKNKGLFSGVFHLQLAEDVLGYTWYIEGSRRISGTSLVNISRGYNPFILLTSGELMSDTQQFKEGVWYRYEDFLTKTSNAK